MWFVGSGIIMGLAAFYTITWDISYTVISIIFSVALFAGGYNSMKQRLVITDSEIRITGPFQSPYVIDITSIHAFGVESQYRWYLRYSSYYAFVYMPNGESKRVVPMYVWDKKELQKAAEYILKKFPQLSGV